MHFATTHPMLELEVAPMTEHERLAVIDDDPTGIQTAAGVPLALTWEEDDLAWALEAADPIFGVLTNSRALSGNDAEEINRTVGLRLARLADRRGLQLRVISRSDSTLRGHFPQEVEALIDGLSEGRDPSDGVLLCPAFPEAGRITVGDVHQVRVGDRWLPAAETEFARDARFGYRASHLADWVSERCGVPTPVGSLALSDLRSGVELAAEKLIAAFADARYVIANAEVPEDLQRIAEAVSLAERRGLRIVYRTGPSFVSARAGRDTAAPLTSGAIAPGPGPGLLVVGSHTDLTTAQLNAAEERHSFTTVALDAEELVSLPTAKRAEVVEHLTKALAQALSHGDAALVTSRRFVPSDPAPSTSSPSANPVVMPSAIVADTISTVVGSAVSEVPPAWIVAKGGITSHDTAARALNARRAIVLGQLLPGKISMWALGSGSRVPGLRYVVFPGNVGRDDTLAEVLDRLKEHH